MKPDVIGPGVNILAAWSEIAGPTGLEKDTRKTKFNIMSGINCFGVIQFLHCLIIELWY